MARPSKRVVLSLAMASTATGAAVVALALAGTPDRSLLYALAAYMVVALATFVYLLTTMPRVGGG